MNLRMISFKESCKFTVDFLKVMNPQAKKYSIGFHISYLFLKNVI
jgi:hypothetical protein